MIKSGQKIFEFREAHITFICEETKEQLRKEITGIRLVKNIEQAKDLLKEERLIEFELE